MARELARHMRRGGGMAGESGEHAAALIKTGVGIGLAHDALRAWLMHVRIKRELAATRRILHRVNNAPAGNDLGEARYVVLGVDRANAERMQLQDLAREIFIEAAAAIPAGLRVRADGARIVEIKEHGRMRLDR